MRNIIYLLSLLLTFNVGAQSVVEPVPNEMEIKFFQDVNNRPEKFEKFEIGIHVTSVILDRIEAFKKNEDDPKALNPFLQWETHVYADFYHEATGVTKRIQGFYYNDFSRSRDMKTWDKVDTDYPFRIRFAPPEEGQWEVTVHFAYNYKGVMNEMPTKTGAFLVKDSDNPGYMKISENKRNFELGGKPVVPIGMNMPNPYEWKAMFPKDGISRVTPFDCKRYNDSLRMYADIGGKFFRLILSPAANGLEFEDAGNYMERLDYAHEMDKVFDLLDERGLYVNFNLMLHTWMEIHAAYYMFRFDWDDTDCDSRSNGYKKKFGLEKPSDLFKSDEALKYLKERYRYIIARWGYSSKIHTIELQSETGHLDEDKGVELTTSQYSGNTYCRTYTGTGNKPYKTDTTVMKAQYKFNYEMSKFIKEDLKHDEHILGVSYLGFSHKSNELLQRHDPTMSLKYIDAIGLNYYSTSAAKDLQLYKNISYFQKTFNKPVYFSETGPSSYVNGCEGNITYEVDAWMTMFSGVSGYNLWAGFSVKESDGHFNGRSVWKYLVDASEFFNREEIKGQILLSDWSHSQMERRKLKKHLKTGVAYGYVSEDKVNGFGIVYNRTNNSTTYFDSTFSDANCQLLDACDCDNDPIGNWREGYYKENDYLGYKMDLPAKHMRRYLKLKKLLKFKKYRVIWYDKNGDPVSDHQIVRSNLKGEIKLKHPTLKTDGTSPFALYRLYKL
jgi:hypothetical protein